MRTQCKICGNHEGNHIYKVKERRFNHGDLFNYLLCNSCNVLQLIDEIEDIGAWYPQNYNAWEVKRFLHNYSTLNGVMHRAFMKLILNVPITGILAEKLWNRFHGYMVLNGLRLNLKSRILDVGCGSGGWLFDISRCGFDNLTGVDLYAPKGASNIKFIRGDIYNQELGKYDLITFHHSFEHMMYPKDILVRARALLDDNGKIVIRIPVMGIGWERYGVDWYQIDAPRHYYLFSEKAMILLCKQAKLKIDKVIYDSSPGQFAISNLYKNSLMSYDEIRHQINKTELDLWWKETNVVNRCKKGDSAAFYISKNN